MSISLTPPQKRASTLPPPCAQAFGDLLTPPYTVASLAAALMVCPHPDALRAAIDTTSPSFGPGVLHRCGHCGAEALLLGRYRADPPRAEDWKAPLLVGLMSPAMALDLVSLDHAIAELEKGTAMLIASAVLGGNPARMTEDEGNQHLEQLELLHGALAEISAWRALADSSRVAAALDGVQS